MAESIFEIGLAPFSFKNKQPLPFDCLIQLFCYPVTFTNNYVPSFLYIFIPPSWERYREISTNLRKF